MTTRLLGGAWGVLVAGALLRWKPTPRPLPAAIASRLHHNAIARVVFALSARRAQARTDRAIAREIPVAVDLLAVGVGAGLTPVLAVEACIASSPPHVGAVLARVAAGVHAGRRFSDTLHAVAIATPALRPVADALLASERFGAPVAPALLRVAAESRAHARRQAEMRARSVPVRLLFPLVFLVLPAFGLLTIVPAVADGLAR